MIFQAGQVERELAFVDRFENALVVAEHRFYVQHKLLGVGDAVHYYFGHLSVNFELLYACRRSVNFGIGSF